MPTKPITIREPYIHPEIKRELGLAEDWYKPPVGDWIRVMRPDGTVVWEGTT